MKNFVILLLTLSVLLLCSCTTDTSGYKTELVSSKWYALLDGGAEVNLSFDDDTACFCINNAEKSCKIEGKYIADDKTFVIFVPEIAQNYGFSYTPKNSTLELGFGEHYITLERYS